MIGFRLENGGLYEVPENRFQVTSNGREVEADHVHLGDTIQVESIVKIIITQDEPDSVLWYREVMLWQKRFYWLLSMFVTVVIAVFVITLRVIL